MAHGLDNSIGILGRVVGVLLKERIVMWLVLLGMLGIISGAILLVIWCRRWIGQVPSL
jgi:hypothetical protein